MVGEGTGTNYLLCMMTWLMRNKWGKRGGIINKSRRLHHCALGVISLPGFNKRPPSTQRRRRRQVRDGLKQPASAAKHTRGHRKEEKKVEKKKKKKKKLAMMAVSLTRCLSVANGRGGSDGIFEGPLRLLSHTLTHTANT